MHYNHTKFDVLYVLPVLDETITKNGFIFKVSCMGTWVLTLFVLLSAMIKAIVTHIL